MIPLQPEQKIKKEGKRKNQPFYKDESKDVIFYDVESNNNNNRQQ